MRKAKGGPVNRRALLAIAGVVLAVHAWLVIDNLTMDGDTLRLAGSTARLASFRESLSWLGSKVVLYAVQPPILWATARAGAVVYPAWSPLSAARLMTILAILAIAVLLAMLARDAGAGPVGQCAASLFPFCWHGLSFLSVSCDDNVVADALRLAVVLAAVRWLSRPAGRRRHLAVGIALGTAMSWHFQSVLLLPAMAIAGAWNWRREGATRLRETVEALAIGVVAWAAWVGFCAAAGRGPAPSVAALVGATAESHHDTKLWFLTSSRSVVEQAAVIWEGWSRMVLGFEWLRPAGGWIPVVAAMALAVTAFASSAVALSGTVFGRVLAPVLAIQIAHSLLYESDSVERWDVPAMLSGLVAVAAVARLRRSGALAEARRLGIGWAGLALLLAACNVTGYVRFSRNAEAVFLDVIDGRRKIEAMGVDCVGAHWRLCRAARAFAPEIGPWDSFGRVIQGRAPDEFHQYWVTNWFVNYLLMYAPGFFDRKGMRLLSVSLVRPPPRGLWRLVRQEGFIYLVEPVRPSRP
ncbi:MAG: hypothetical protein AAB152_05100 [Candidatus Coatesbacteria bacterium]